MAACDMANQCLANCEDNQVPGIIGEEVLIVPFSDIDKDASLQNVSGEFTQIVLKAGAVAFIWQGSPDSVKASSNGSTAEFVSSKFMHMCTVTGYGSKWIDKKKFQSLMRGLWVVFVRTKDLNIHIFGWDTGLNGESSVWNPIENDGTFQIVLQTKATQYEGKHPRNFVGIPPATLTEAWETLEALATPC
jgi:hypothetical protein